MGDFLEDSARYGGFGLVGAAVTNRLDVNEAQRREARVAEKLGRIQADEVSAALTADLNDRLSMIDAAIAASGRDPTSPTAAALRERTTQAGLTDVNRERTGRLFRLAQERRAGSLSRQQGLVGGLTQDAVTIARLSAGAA